VGELGKDMRAEFMHAIHQVLEITHGTGMVYLDEAFKGSIPRVNGNLTENNEAASPFCPTPVVAHVTSMEPSISAEMRPVREETDAILKNRLIKFKGRKKMVKHYAASDTSLCRLTRHSGSGSEMSW
jgi:hypothetical protein